MTPRTLAMSTMLALAPLAAHAVDEPDAPVSDRIEGLDPSQPPPGDAEAQALAHSIGSELRCPVCQGLSVVDSNSNAAVSMQRRIEALVRAGYTRTEIEDYFISKYGEWVLLKPRQTGLNQILWFAPLLGAGIGLLAAGMFLRQRQSDRGPDTIVDDVTRAPEPTPDPYVAALLNEVDDES